MKIKLLLFVFPPLMLAAIGMAAQAGPGGSNETRLASLHFVGSHRYSEAEIIRASGLKLGTAVSKGNLDEVAGRLGSLGVFASVRYRYTTRGDALSVEFQVVDGTQFLPVAFDNFVWFSDAELLAGLKSRVALFDGQIPPSGDIGDQLARALENMLAEHVEAAHVSYTPNAQLGGPVTGWTYKVDGIHISIHAIGFPGAQQVETSLLDAAVHPLFESDYQRSFVRTFGVQNVRPVYLAHGYLRASTGIPTARLVSADPHAPAVDVSIPVDEGPLYTLGSVRFAGNVALSAEKLAKEIQVVQGKAADAIELQRDFDNVHGLYADEGYLAATLESHQALQDPQHEADYEVQVREGDLYRMGKLEVVGLEPDAVSGLESGCKLRAGDVYHRQYWKVFLRDNARYVPQPVNAWNISRSEKLDNQSKTVNVSWRFTHK